MEALQKRRPHHFSLPDENAAIASRRTAVPACVPPGSGSLKLRLITLAEYNISMYEAMNVICKECGLQWSIKDSLVMIESKENVRQLPQSNNK